MPDVVRIEPFRPEHAGAYAALNRPWLVEHSLIECTRLMPALRLYQRLGFRHRQVPADAHYQTADVYMELELAPSDT